MLATVFFIIPFALWRTRTKPVAFWFGFGAGAMGIGLAAFYLLPALTLQSYISQELLWSEYYTPSTWSVWIMHDPIYLLSIPVIAVGMLLLASGRWSVWLFLTVCAAVFALGLIPGVWELPLLSRAQFPWRLLSIVEFTAITAFALARPRAAIVAAGFSILLAPYAVNAFETFQTMQISGDDPSVADYRDAPEYLPPGFDVDRVTDLDRRVELDRYRDLPAGDRFVVTSPGPVVVHRNAFPIWRVVKNGETVLSHGPLITFDATPGTYRLERVTLWQEWLGWVISLSSLVVLVGGLTATIRLRSPSKLPLMR